MAGAIRQGGAGDLVARGGAGPGAPAPGPGPRGYGTFTVTASLKVPTGWPAGVRAITRTW